MDEGAPISYLVVEKGVLVFASDGAEVGTVDHVVDAPEQDIFHGIVIATSTGKHFVEAADVAALHERGVDLRIDSAAVPMLPQPHGRAPVYDDDPAAQTKWSHVLNRMRGRKDWHERN